jgi:hypothetical protein
MKMNQGFEKISRLLKQAKAKKPPAYPWQELALRIISELSVPRLKRNAVFRVCKNNPRFIIEKALNDTKELCRSGEKWKYFFKLLSKKSD